MESEDESSDSSNEFLVRPEKLNLNDSFFNNVPSTSKTKPRQSSKSESDDNSSDDDFICPDADIDTNALLAEVMKNLEKSNAAMATCFEEMPATSLSSPSKIKNKNDKVKEQKKPTDLKNEINDLLLKGESGLGSSQFVSDSDDNPEPLEEKPAVAEYSIPKEGVDITLPDTRMVFNRRKKGSVDLQTQLIKRMNQRLRLNQLLVHKVGLLCWLSHGFHLNRTINDPEIMAVLLSLIPSKIYPNGRVDIKYVEGFTNWFRKCIKVEFNKDNVPMTNEVLLNRLSEQKTHNYRELVLLFIAALRAMGINSRLIISLCPPPMKLKHSQLFQAKKCTDDDKGTKKEEKDGDNKKENQEKKSKEIKKVNRKKLVNKEKNKSKIFPENSNRADNIAKEEAKKRAVELLRSKFAVTDDKRKLTKDGIPEKSEKKSSPRVTRSRAKSQAPENLKNEEIKKPEPKSTEVKGGDKGKKVEKKNVKVKKLKKESDYEEEIKEMSESEVSLEEESSSEDSDLENFKPKRKLAAQKKKRSSENTSHRRQSNSRKVLSSDDEEEGEIIDIRDARYLWVEVYVESEESWISVSVPDNKVHCVSDIYKKAPTPVLYVIAWNSAGSIKDVTRRYCPHWLTVTRKQRVEEAWWSETLLPWNEKKTTVSKAEDEMLLQMEMEQPLPDSVGKYKGHPLYVLVRHLLKYEALYPPDCVPIGHLKNGEAVYSRHCVHTLRSRETWLKEARIVKPKQEAYKIVKSMPKHDKFTGQIVKDQPLELFGKWQTMQYDPPVAKNGIVPRNEYGNVDLFKQCMLPKGTVHIDLPGLGRVAKKLNIDCVAAVVGFNFGCRGAMPKTEGFVVCEEYETIIREAWENEQVAAAKRAQEKRDKRIWGNWRKLIRGLLIKQRLALKYNMRDEDDDNDNDKNDKGSDSDDPKQIAKGKRTKIDKKPVKKRKVSEK